jgi:hypothetical protein
MSRHLTAIVCFIVCSLALYNGTGNSAEPSFRDYGLDSAKPLVVDKAAGEVRVLAELRPDAFAGGWFQGTPGHHAVVSRHGGAAKKALLAAEVDDADFHDAMVAVGAVPGNNLTVATWEERNNPGKPEPDVRVEGTRIQVLVWWEGLPSPVPLKNLFLDAGGRGLDLRFGGNKALIKEWRSGCIVCLCSCPGGKVSNHSFTVRDYVRNPNNFSLNAALVPKGTRKAVVIFRIERDRPQGS